MRYHAHIYWQNEDQRREALSLREPLREMGAKVGSIHDEPIGPHPYAMYQVNYNSDIAETVEGLLSKTKLDILLHEDTGNDVRDHTEGTRWLGRELKLDLAWLEEYTRNNHATSTNTKFN